MSKYTKEDIIRLVREGDVEFIRMQFTDIFGQLKNVAITASQVEKAVNNEIMIDGSSIEGFVRINESDQYLRPDLDTFAILRVISDRADGSATETYDQFELKTAKRSASIIEEFLRQL